MDHSDKERSRFNVTDAAAGGMGGKNALPRETLTGGGCKGTNLLQRERRPKQYIIRQGSVSKFHNPDPLIRLIGEPNETYVQVEGIKNQSIVRFGSSTLLDYQDQGK